MSVPRLSVVIPAVSGEDAAESCAKSIRRFPGASEVELVVVKARAGTSLLQLRAEGVRRAAGPAVAVLGDRYEVTAQWMEAALRPTEFDALGGCVSPRPGLSYFGWCVYLAEYAQLAPPLTDGPTMDPRGLPGGNTVYRRAAVNPERLAECATELLFHAKLIADGASAGRATALEVVFADPKGALSYVRERFEFSFAIARERRQPWRLVLSPILPAAVLARTAQASWRHREFFRRWLLCAPVILALGVVQAAGDLLGHAMAGMSS